jgi:hypothetical protein
MKKKCPFCRQMIEVVNGLFVVHDNKAGVRCSKSGFSRKSGFSNPD